MDKTELKKELDQMLDQMPVLLVREILDFAEFLLSKSYTESKEMSQETSSLSQNETMHLEEEFKNYQTLYPKKKQNG
jgi:hypothetical protein